MIEPRTPNSLAAPSWMNTLGWAAYLGMSWTWCIGMFLPVLLIRDYGIWGFVVFAVPNVVGAAAMGWVLRDGASERIVERNRTACVLFSMVTIAFQCFFLGWVPLGLIENLESQAPLEPGFTMLWAFGAAAAVALLGLGYWKWPKTMMLSAVVTLAFSILAACILAMSGAIEMWREPAADSLHRGPSLRLALLAPVCFFGFSFCPYLDLTFHRARQSLAQRPSQAAFGIGFGVLFCAMILITLLVTPLVLSLLGMNPGRTVRWLVAWPLIMHLLLQLVYTIEVHAVELTRKHGPRTLIGLGICTLAVIFVFIGRNVEGSQLAGLSRGEVLYRCFMAFYGLVFPAYVWLCMIPTSDGHSGIDGSRGRWKLIVLTIAVLLAAPCFWMGFIERQEIWLAPGLGAVLIARIFVRGSRTLSVPA